MIVTVAAALAGAAAAQELRPGFRFNTLVEQQVEERPLVADGIVFSLGKNSDLAVERELGEVSASSAMSVTCKEALADVLAKAAAQAKAKGGDAVIAISTDADPNAVGSDTYICRRYRTVAPRGGPPSAWTVELKGRVVGLVASVPISRTHSPAP